jgi:preprotein translocase subunit SecE
MPEGTATVSKQPTQTAQRPNSFEQIRRYLRESRIELKKVTWPTREQTVNLTLVVVVVCVVIALFLGGIDWLFVNLIKLISSS